MGRNFGNVEAVRPNIRQVVALATSATAVASSAFGAQTFTIRIASPISAGVYYAIGVAPTATTSDSFLPNTWVEYVRVSPGEKISAITLAGTGNLSVTEVI